MQIAFESGTISNQKWEFKGFSISHNIVNYRNYGKSVSQSNDETIRLHFGLKGNYNFYHHQLKQPFSLYGQLNNLMFSKDFTIEVENQSLLIETFGINFSKPFFLKLTQNSTEELQQFSQKVIEGKPVIISNVWKPNTLKMQLIVNEMINCSFCEKVKTDYLQAKAIELLTLQVQLYNKKQDDNKFVKTKKDKNSLLDAKQILLDNIENPPTISELAQLAGINEFKLKRGFKELFGTTVFGFTHNLRMQKSRQMLIDTRKSCGTIAFEVGYSSPQLFTRAFKKHFGFTPTELRKNPDLIKKQTLAYNNLAF